MLVLALCLVRFVVILPTVRVPQPTRPSLAISKVREPRRAIAGHVSNCQTVPQSSTKAPHQKTVNVAASGREMSETTHGERARRRHLRVKSMTCHHLRRR